MSTPLRAEDVMSVGTRVSWGAIVAGAVLALALFFLLTLLGSAVGVSLTDRVEAGNLRTAAVVWTIVTTCAAVFVGGLQRRIKVYAYVGLSPAIDQWDLF